MTADVKVQGAIAATRFGLGARPGEITAAQQGPRAWLLTQIRPQGADQPQGALTDSRTSLALYRRYVQDRRELKEERAKSDGGGAVGMTPATDPKPMQPGPAPDDGAVKQLQQHRRREGQPLRQAVGAEMLARTQLGATTAAGFRERWALFWANHFTVSAAKFRVAVLAGPFEREAIRPHVFGRFNDLLFAASTHPAMLMYLDQANSVGPDSPSGERRRAGLNENLGREIMELHTLGADAGYTQADVTEFARALTGYSIGLEREGGYADQFVFRERIHEPGTRKVFGRTYGQSGPDQARAILADLAADPRTARRIARKIAVHFVSEDPPQTLTSRLSDSWTRSRGDLAEVARTLVESPEAWSETPAKFKTPNEFLLSSYRAAGAAPQTAAEVVEPLTELGQRPFSSPQPNGWSEAAGDWASGSAMVKRLQFSRDFADRFAPQLAPAQLADNALGEQAGAKLRTALARAETRPEAMTVLLMSPEFQRR